MHGKLSNGIALKARRGHGKVEHSGEMARHVIERDGTEMHRNTSDGNGIEMHYKVQQRNGRASRDVAAPGRGKARH